MSNTRPDVTINNTTYSDIYALSGIPVGTSLLIQNKSNIGAYIQIKSFQPASNSQDGIFLEAYNFYVLDSGESGCWAKGATKLSVQEIV